jgi:hypothetical protein
MPASNKDNEAKVKKVCKDLISDAVKAGLAGDVLEPITKHVVPAFVEANTIADENRRKHMRSALWVYLLSFIAICIVVIQYMFFNCSHWIVVGEIIAIAVAYFLIFREGRQQFQQEWLIHRYRAEMLRMLMYTPLLRSPRGRAEELIQGNSLTRQTERIDDVVLDLYNNADLNNCELDSTHEVALAKFLRDSWLNKQVEHQQKTAGKNHHWVHRTHQITNGLVITIVLAAGLHAWHPFKWYDVFGGPKGWDLTVLLTLLLPALVVGLHGFAQTCDWERAAGRAHAMDVRLSRIVSMIQDGTPRIILDNIIDDAEETIVRELAEWHEYTPEGPKHAG